MAGTLMLVDHMLGVRSTAPTTIWNADAETFAYPMFGVPQKIQEITRSRFVE